MADYEVWSPTVSQITEKKGCICEDGTELRLCIADDAMSAVLLDK